MTCAFSTPLSSNRGALPGTSGHTCTVLGPNGKVFFFFFVESPLRLFDMRRVYLFSLPCSWLLCTCVEKTVVIHTWVKGTNVYLTLYRTKISGFYCHIKQPQALFWAQHRISFRHNCHKWMDHLLNKWVHLTCLLSIHPSYRSQKPYFEIFCLQSVSGYVYNLSNISLIHVRRFIVL